jgi:hypothetical protein
LVRLHEKERQNGTFPFKAFFLIAEHPRLSDGGRMNGQSFKAAIAVTGAGLIFQVISQSSLTDAVAMRHKPRSARVRPNLPGETQQRVESDRGVLSGEWRVKCTHKIYENGELRGSSEESGESLVVANSDPDGSYYVYKFPVGFGEAVPRLRKTGANYYAGDDTVKGIEHTVNQGVEIENDRITISQSVLGSPGRQTLSQTNCTGQRLREALSFESGSSAPELCSSGPSSNELPPGKLSRRYKSVKPFSDGLAAVAIAPRGTRTLKWGFVDRAGRVVIPLRYDVVGSFRDGLAPVGVFYGRGRNTKWGIVEKLGPQVTPHVNFDAVKILGEGFAAVGYPVPGRPGLRWNLTNREYTLIFHGFDDIGCFVNGQSRASYRDGKVIRRVQVDRAGNLTPIN